MLERAWVDQLTVPLANPYHLSHTTVESLDVVLVRLTTDEGLTAVGEATPLAGYFESSVDDVHREVRSLVEAVVGLSHEEALERIHQEDVSSELARSAVASALALLSADAYGPIDAPVVGIVSADAGVEECIGRVGGQVGAGYEVVKVKVGFDPAADAERVRALSDTFGDEVRFRADANQGYTYDEACEFLDTLTADDLALLEQPLPVDRLDRSAALRVESDVPLMLDEDVRGVRSLEDIVERESADMVKFKLMKQGSPATVRRMSSVAQEHGLGVVLGNGVQTDIGCLHEGLLWTELGLQTAGEFNGWLKQEQSLLVDPPRFERGSLVWGGERPEPDEDALQRFQTRSTSFEA